MTRFVGGFSVFLFVSSFALAQSPAPVQPAAQPAATSAESPEIREFQKIEDSWADAINQRDQYALELVLSPLFVDVAASGDISTRNQQLAQLITGEDKTLHLEQRVITVRMLGDIAVANGTYVLHHKAASAEKDEKGVFTHVFERAHSGWLCINSQRTLLREDSNAKPKRQSSAEMPFHIPLFTKGDKNPQ
ncbi:MAG: nuclear transport factor 2 family protein [Terracidiphilus sp.]|jgi:ketosteroid isomerase-like protein